MKEAFGAGGTAPWVIVCGGFHLQGGMDRANHALCRTLLDQGRTVHLVGHHISSDLLQHPNVKATLVPRPFNSTLLGQHELHRTGMNIAAKVTREYPAARVLVNGGNCRWPDINWVHSVHSAWPRFDEDSPFWFRTKSAFYKKRAKRDERTAISQAKVVIANSSRTKRDLQQMGVPAEKIRVIYLGCDPGWKPPGGQEKQRARARLGLSLEAKVIAFVGALGWDRNKGLDTLLKALQTARLPDTYLLAAGAGRGFEYWQREVERSGLQTHVRMIGFTDQIEDVYAASDMLVSPVRYEAFGLNVQEAICRGVPAIVSASAGVAELYPTQLGNYLLQAPEDPRGLAQRLKEWHATAATARLAFAPFADSLRARTWGQMACELIQSV